MEQKQTHITYQLNNMPESVKIQQAKVGEAIDQVINEEKEQLEQLKESQRSKLEITKKILNEKDLKIQQAIEIDSS